MSIFWAATTSFASALDTIGVSLLRAVTTNLDGSGVRVEHVEAATSTTSPTPFEVNPSSTAVPVGKLTYFTGPPTSVPAASSTAYPNALGAESGHADSVGGLFYGLSWGVSTNVLRIDNYEANYFFSTVVPGLIAINGPVVNQSFIAASTVAQQQIYDSYYDSYSAQYGTLFVSAVGNTGPVSLPSTCYNGIGVGAYQGGSSVGPTPDNGRAKPDIVAPQSETSYATPLVSGAATLLRQAAWRGDGGPGTNAAASITIKALLLNGAIKPADWANPSPSPLDARYGAGVVNVFNSYKQLAGGRHGYIESNTVSTGSAHPPLGSATNVSSLSGWDYNTIASSVLVDGVNHYYFNIRGNPSGPYTGTMTLVWNRQAHITAINNLDLFLYDTASGALMGASTSVVDNVEHIYVPQLPQGRYDLQVLDHGGTNLTSTATYALAFEFFSLPLTITPSASGLALSWPVYPAGFQLESTPSLNAPVSWTPVNVTPLVTNQQNVVTLTPVTGSQFFRLSR